MTSWIIPCNLKYYDILGAFGELDKLDWKQSNPCIKKNDIVYIYVGAPIKAILYKCFVTKAGLDKIEIDGSKFGIQKDIYEQYPLHMELTLIKKYSHNDLTADILQQYGLKGRIMCQRRMEPSLQLYVDSL